MAIACKVRSLKFNGSKEGNPFLALKFLFFSPYCLVGVVLIIDELYLNFLARIYSHAFLYVLFKWSLVFSPHNTSYVLPFCHPVHLVVLISSCPFLCSSFRSLAMINSMNIIGKGGLSGHTGYILTLKIVTNRSWR